ncbi:hypothetical protein L7F22_008555 [Adiantum nelumboides]|nr:hypothetical protein [Adiantum nelumboides]
MEVGLHLEAARVGVRQGPHQLIHLVVLGDVVLLGCVGRAAHMLADGRILVEGEVHNGARAQGTAEVEAERDGGRGLDRLVLCQIVAGEVGHPNRRRLRVPQLGDRTHKKEEKHQVAKGVL